MRLRHALGDTLYMGEADAGTPTWTEAYDKDLLLEVAGKRDNKPQTSGCPSVGLSFLYAARCCPVLLWILSSRRTSSCTQRLVSLKSMPYACTQINARVTGITMVRI